MKIATSIKQLREYAEKYNGKVIPLGDGLILVAIKTNKGMEMFWLREAKQ